MRILIKYYYIGLQKYYGSQRQVGMPTIEDTIIKALLQKNYIKDARDGKVDFSSRTDRLVSARGAAFSFNSKRKPILMEINTALPPEIGVWASSIVKEDFSSRYSAYFRHYRYIVPEPVSYLETESPLDFEILKKACSLLEGTHDFSNFSKRGKEDIKTKRTIDKVAFSVKEGYLIFDFMSRAFLRQQIRRMVKKLIEVSSNMISLNEFQGLFNSSEYISYQPAEPEGLILWDVDYGPEIQFKEDEKSVQRRDSFFQQQYRKYSLKKELFKTFLD